MFAETTNSTIELTPVRQMAQQNRRIANANFSAFQLIETAMKNSEIAALLAARGYNQAKFDEGMALYRTAEATFNTRQQAIADQQEATGILNALEAKLRGQFRDFRAVGRALFKSDADRTALVLSGHLPRDRQQLLANAQAAFKAAKHDRYQADLALYGGFSAEVLDAAVAEVEELARMDNLQNRAIGKAVLATEERDRAAANLNDWIVRFRALARLALKGKTEMLKALEVRQ